jgi:hypothetical protein
LEANIAAHKEEAEKREKILTDHLKEITVRKQDRGAIK